MTSTTLFNVASPIPKVESPAPTTALTVQARPRVSPDQKGRYFEVHAIARYDARLAEKLRQSFDFSDVIEKRGARLTHTDVYKVFAEDANTFARFETIVRGLSEAQDIRKSTSVIGGVGAGLGLLGAGAMVYFGMPVFLQIVFDTLMTFGCLRLTVAASEEFDKDADRRLARIPHDLNELKSLPPPAAETIAKAD